LEQSLGRLCDGEPGAVLDISASGALTDIAEKIASLRDELVELYEDMDSRVARQTARLAQKTASLKILYDVAATINQTSSLDELLLRFLRVLKEMIGGRTATVRLISPEGESRLVGSIGLDNEVLRDEQLFPVRLCPCGKALTPGDILCGHRGRFCRELNGGHDMYGEDEIDRIRVPLEYLGRTQGAYDVFVGKPGIAEREDIRELLSTVGHHLGMAVAKQRSDAEARRLFILEERTNLAHELHDSLAQTLASLRFQVRLLADTLSQESGGGSARREVDRIRSGLDQAHTELRELLNSFRGPVDRRGLLPALERVVQKFRDETGIAAFLQKDCRQIDLSAGEELQLIRIVQEALANVRKHANAHFVRILVRCRGGAQGYVRLLVEDDGEGFGDPGLGAGEPGEHLGLTIMQQRASRLGAELRVESEPGEGTRVEFNYRPSDRMRQFSVREDLT